MSVIGYLRVSTDEQDYGCDVQRATIEAWAKREGITVDVWREEHISGPTPIEDRPVLMEVVEQLQHGRRDERNMIVSSRRDRLARDVAQALALQRLARENGGTVATTDASYDDTPEAWLLRTMLDVFAEYECKVIRRRVKETMRLKRSRRERTSRHTPFGWKLGPAPAADPAGERRPHLLVEDPEEQRLLVRIEELAGGGATPGAIARVLQKDGLTFRGGPWHRNTIARILNRL